jgi:hypothetical protein
MALAKYLSRVKEEQPLKRGILFLNVGAHTLGRLGESYFVTKHKDGILSKTALVVSVEHIGKRFMPQRDRSFKTDEFHLFRSFLITNNKQIEKMVESAIKNNDFRRSLVVPQEFVLKATGKARGISGEFYEAGFPVVGLLSSPNYLFFKEDTPEAVAEDQLVPTVEVILSILRAADDYPIETFKEGES